MRINDVSTIPLLCVALTVFWLWLGVRSLRHGSIAREEFAALIAWLFVLGLWGVTSARFAHSGFYDSATFLSLLPGLWWPLIPMLLTGCMMVAVPFRRALFAVVGRHSRALVAIHALRIAAIGGVLKGLNGLLPPSFALSIGIPDLVIGVSALGFAVFWPKNGWPPRALIAWNVLGVVVILPAPLLAQMGLPGPLYVFASDPDARALFDYPMVLAPTLIVPLLMTMNAIHATVLWLQRSSGVARE